MKTPINWKPFFENIQYPILPIRQSITSKCENLNMIIRIAFKHSCNLELKRVYAGFI